MLTTQITHDTCLSQLDGIQDRVVHYRQGVHYNSAVDGYTAKLGKIVRVISGYDTTVNIPDQVSLLLAHQWYKRLTQTKDNR